MPPVVEISGLVKRYGQNEAVRGIDLSVEGGECFALLGPNGAGKTTTVEILEGYRKRSSGSVSVLGLDPQTGGRAYRERIGIVLQSQGIEQEITVEEVLDLSAGYYPAPRKTGEVIELIGLTDKADARVRTLSGGQKRRLDLGLGIIGDPELIFLDEPTTGFDPSARRRAWTLIADLRTLGKTIFLTTHYMDEAQNLADRVAVIADGRIVAQGDPASIGGRDVAAAEIRFRLAAGTSLSELPDELRASAPRGDADVVITTATPTRALATLTSWALGRGIELDGLSVARPTLEDVYLALTATSEARDV